MEQDILKFDFTSTEINTLFYVSEKNYFANKFINSWPKWKNQCLFIYGPKDCGKTHISKIWKKKSNAKLLNKYFFQNLEEIEINKEFNSDKSWIIEDIDLILKENNKSLEEKILNFLNLKGPKDYVLITSKKPPSQFITHLDDLVSRLRASLVVEVKEPDEILLKKIILKHLENRQITITDKQLNFLINRIERTYSCAKKMSSLIDEITLKRHSKISNEILSAIIKSYNNDYSSR